MKCQARQHSDQMHCAKCRLTWDANDPDPPVCRVEVKATVTAPGFTVLDRSTKQAKSAFEQARDTVRALLGEEATAK